MNIIRRQFKPYRSLNARYWVKCWHKLGKDRVRIFMEHSLKNCDLKTEVWKYTCSGVARLKLYVSDRD